MSAEAGDAGDGGRVDLAFDRGGKGHQGLLDKWKFSACSPPPLFPARRRARLKPSIILGEHDREHAPRERCVRWIFLPELEGGIIIVDLEEVAFAREIEGVEESFRSEAGRVGKGWLRRCEFR